MRHIAIIFQALLLSGCFLSTFSASLRAQNLVMNPGFEQHTATSLMAGIESASGWDSPNGVSARLYGSDASGNIYDQYGSTWEFKARSGRTVAAMNVYGSSDNDPEDHEREYIQGRLVQELKIGKKYYFSFWVHYHCEGANNIGITFLPEALSLPTSGQIDLTPAAWQHEVTPYLRTKTWTQVTDSFVAYEAYSHFVIGNFFSDDETQVQQTGIGHHLAYIDDVEVIEAEDDAMLVSRSQPDQSIWTDNLRQLQKLKNPGSPDPLLSLPDPNSPLEIEKLFQVMIYFDLDRYTLDEDDKRVLDRLATRMVANPDMRVMATGHASGEGGSSYNYRLSDLRARAVRSYLVSKGVDANHITVMALGEEAPAVSNDTESNRSRNRRVSFRIVW